MTQYFVDACGIGSSSAVFKVRLVTTTNRTRSPMKRPMLFAVALGLLSPCAHAANYFVDSQLGSDQWSGKHSSPTGTDGPWRSIGRIATAALAPGDTVHLKCGGIWNEPMPIPASGTAGQPIEFKAYPAPCSTRPLVDGSIKLPASAWSLHNGKIYRATIPLTLVPNTGFENGFVGWRIWNSKGDASITEGSDCSTGAGRCLSFASGTGVPNALLTSPRFNVQSPIVVSFRMKAQIGSVIRIVLRNDVSPWETLSSKQSIVGSGNWATFNLTFPPSAFAQHGRFDFEVQPNQRISIDDVQVGATIESAHMVVVDNLPAVRARHPNPGHDPVRPSSPYFSVAQDSDVVSTGTSSGSNFLTRGADFQLPSGGALTPGLGIAIRTGAWLIDERTIQSNSGNRITLNQSTSYPLKSGWGYYLTGALWMLDAPGEWHYDQTSRSLYVWMPDGAVPGDRVSLASGTTAIDLTGRSNILIEGIAVRRFNKAVVAPNSQNIVLRDMEITDTTSTGIDVAGSKNSVIEQSTFARTGREAISSLNRSTWAQADGLRVTDNSVSEAGVVFRNGKIASAPIRLDAAVTSGSRSYVARNQISNSAINGIWPRQDSQVEQNYIENLCLLLDDCAAIYLGHASNTVVSGNLIVRSVGSTDGKPQAISYTQAQGIYLDDQASDVTVTNNTVFEADYGIQVHNARNSRIEANTLFNNRRGQIWLQTTTNVSNPAGDVYANVVTDNLMVPSTSGPSLIQSTTFQDTAAFASYNANVYSALLSQQIVREAWATGEILYDFTSWQSARSPGGVPRSLDSAGRQVTLGGHASYRITGPSIVPNGDLQSGIAQWESWSASSQAGTLSYANCSGVGPCLRFDIGVSAGIVSTPNFSIVKDQWYRVSFDLLAGDAGQPLSWVVRRGGGGTNGYEAVMPSQQKVLGSTAWQRHMYIFKATKTINANDAVTHDRGARLDFQGDSAGKTFWIANVEIVPASPVGAALKIRGVHNPTVASLLIDCPDTGVDQSYCASYVRFRDGLSINWPYSLPPRSAEVIYSRGDTLIDSDGDGIADVQDQCPSSPKGAQVNSRGCAIAQR